MTVIGQVAAINSKGGNPPGRDYEIWKRATLMTHFDWRVNIDKMIRSAGYQFEYRVPLIRKGTVPFGELFKTGRRRIEAEEDT